MGLITKTVEHLSPLIFAQWIHGLSLSLCVTQLQWLSNFQQAFLQFLHWWQSLQSKFVSPCGKAKSFACASRNFLYDFSFLQTSSSVTSIKYFTASSTSCLLTFPSTGTVVSKLPWMSMCCCGRKNSFDLALDSILMSLVNWWYKWCIQKWLSLDGQRQSRFSNDDDGLLVSWNDHGRGSMPCITVDTPSGSTYALS